MTTPKKTTPKTVSAKAEDLDQEVRAGKKLFVKWKNISLEIDDLANDRGWEEAADILDGLASVNGFSGMKSALKDLLGEAQYTSLSALTLKEFVSLVEVIAERIQVSFGTAGE